MKLPVVGIYSVCLSSGKTGGSAIEIIRSCNAYPPPWRLHLYGSLEDCEIVNKRNTFVRILCPKKSGNPSSVIGMYYAWWVDNPSSARVSVF